MLTAGFKLQLELHPEGGYKEAENYTLVNNHGGINADRTNWSPPRYYPRYKKFC